MVTIIAPDNGSTGVALNPNIHLVFSEKVNGVDSNAIEVKTDTGTPVVINNIIAGDNNSYTIILSKLLSEKTKYYVYLNDKIKDLDGNSLVPLSFSFTTGAHVIPSVTLVKPSNGSKDVVLNPQIQLLFSEKVQGVTSSNITLKSDDGTAVAIGDIVEVENNSYTFSPSRALAENTTYHLELNNKIIDSDRNSLPPITFSFTTGDYTVPTVSLVSPTNNAKNVSGDLTIKALFSESVKNVGSHSFKVIANPSNNEIVSGGINADAKIQNLFNFAPPAGGFNDGDYKVVLSDQITDLSNNPLPTTIFNFTVKQLVSYMQAGVKNGGIRGSAVTTDKLGNIYVIGYTNTALPGQTQQGTTDFFLAKYDSKENLLFIRQVGAANGTISNTTYSRGVAVDDNGDIYVIGQTTVGILGQPKQGSFDAYLVKFNSTGEKVLFVKQIGLNNQSTYGKDVALDKAGNIYIVGTTYGNTSTGVLDQPQIGLGDYFLAKYDSNGTLIHAKQVGVKGGVTEGMGVAVDNAGNVYVTGYTNVTQSGQMRDGMYEPFLTKYDRNSNLIFTRQIAVNSGFAKAVRVATDESGNAYIVGQTTADILGQPKQGSYNAFIVKYSGQGDLLFARVIGGVGGSADGRSVAIDSLGDAYVSGDATTSILGQSRKGFRDAFLAKYSSSGSLLFARLLGNVPNSGSTYGNGVTVSAYGYIYLTGDTSTPLEGQTQKGLTDYFLAKYQP